MEAQPRRGDRQNPLSVEALVRGVTRLLEQRVGTLWVEGEVSNLRVHGSGHVYFALKDHGAQIAALMWRSTSARLGFALAEGQRLVCKGRFGIYPDQGRFQMLVEAAEPAGLGAAALALEQLKQRLAAEGMFAPQRKRPLPRFPRRIGVVTSQSGAAFRDILRCIERRFPTPVLLSPTRVQGDGAAADVAEAVRRLYGRRGVDVIIVGRGGGSAEDLGAFQSEAVVRAIVHAPVPVISAVGHETDTTLADLAADVRAATPTAAAELAVPERTALSDALALVHKRLRRDIKAIIDQRRLALVKLERRIPPPGTPIARGRQRLDDLAARAEKAMRGLVAARGRQLAGCETRLAGQHPRVTIGAGRGELDRLAPRLEAAMREALSDRQRALEGLAGRLDAMSPLKVLDRGYAIARTAEGHVLTDASVGDLIEVELARGTIGARVEWRKERG